MELFVCSLSETYLTVKAWSCLCVVSVKRTWQWKVRRWCCHLQNVWGQLIMMNVNSLKDLVSTLPAFVLQYLVCSVNDCYWLPYFSIIVCSHWIINSCYVFRCSAELIPLCLTLSSLYSPLSIKSFSSWSFIAVLFCQPCECDLPEWSKRCPGDDGIPYTGVVCCYIAFCIFSLQFFSVVGANLVFTLCVYCNNSAEFHYLIVITISSLCTLYLVSSLLL